MEDNRYQVMPDLSKEERERLKEDIKENGLEMPIDVDENGNILDGHERKSICDELGIPCEKTVHPGMTEEEKFDFAIRVNINRRHLTQEQMTAAIISFHKNHPDLGNRAVAKAVGTNDHAVKDAIAKATKDGNGIDDKCPGAKNSHLDTVKGMDGKDYPADAEKAEQQREAVRNAIADDPGKSDRQVARETGASPSTVGAQRKKMRSFHNPSARDEKALQDPDIVRRLSENDKLNVAGAIREQKRDRLVEHLEDVETKEAKAVGISDVIENETGIKIETVSINKDLYTGDHLVEVNTETDYGYLTGMFGSSYSLSLTNATTFPQLVLYAPGSRAQNMTVPDNGSSLSVIYYCQGSGAAWASQAFGGSTIASSGCSVTSLAMVVTYLTGRYVYPNDVVNKIAEETGDYNTFYVDPVGQSHDIFGADAGYYGLNCASIS